MLQRTEYFETKYSCFYLEEKASSTPVEKEKEKVDEGLSDHDDSRPNVDSQKQDTSKRYFT